AESAARFGGDAFTEARALLVGGILRLWSGDRAEAVRRLEAALELAWTEQFPTLADRCGRWLVRAHAERGGFDQAVELAEPLLARADDRGDPTVGVGVRAALAEVWRQRGDVDQARALAEEALAIAALRDVAPDALADARAVLARLEQTGGSSRPIGTTAAASSKEGDLR
ncbi:MAG: hypothetical protein ACRD0G_15090, partial [Acidimicrobiales bacterium]